ncbi:hypothetical protein [Sphingomonas sp. 3P27F8]|jgi:hypothetical protein|nr:hypothetical protein [Sphingomonas sp. 3P27F8]
MTIARAYFPGMSDPINDSLSQSAKGEAEWQRRPATRDGTTYSGLDPGMLNRETRAGFKPSGKHPISKVWLIAFAISMLLIVIYLLT